MPILIERGGGMIDQLRIGDRYSYDDYEASVRERSIGSPAKKTIKDTVPFSNVTYDFSKIDGELHWEERTLTYILEIDAPSPEELEIKKVDFKSWVMNVFEEELYDAFIEDYHFIATFESIDFDDSEIEKTTITVTFSAYPFMVANSKRSVTFTIPTSGEEVVRITNNSSHKITPTLIASTAVSFKYGETTYAINPGNTTDASFKLDIGTSLLTIQPVSSGGTLTFEFVEEVF